MNPQAPLAFEVLSYTWGDPVAVEEIIVNGQSFAVTSTSWPSCGNGENETKS
jgi:hypothetical protein